MTCDGFSTVWTSSRASGAGRPGLATLLALAIASGCGARSASPTGAAAAPGASSAPAASLDEAGCLALVVSEPAERSRCEGDTRGPCVSEISLEQIQASPARYVCFVLTTHEDWEAVDGEEEMHVSTQGSYTLAVIESAEGAWAVRDTKEYRYWSQEIESEHASIAIETIGPDKKAVVVSERNGMGAYFHTDVTFYLVTSGGLAELFSYSSEVRDDGREERSHHVDDAATTAGHHDIVLSVEEESFVQEEEDEDGSDEPGSREERYRWNGKEYVQVDDE